jgi:hypothetical protein
MFYPLGTDGTSQKIATYIILGSKLLYILGMSEVMIRYVTNKNIPELLPLMTQLGYPITKEELKERFGSFIKYDGYVVEACIEEKIAG